MLVLSNSVSCLESGWCDFSVEHKRVREELERIIELALKEKKYRLPIIVAPYGSGKTSLLRHLKWLCDKRLGIPVLLVELREIVDFIIERYGIVHESMVPRAIEEFFYEKTGSKKGVLLVDEVEESYDVLRGVVEHETSPLRGLAEAAHSGSINIIVVLAFGPSSAFKEAVFGPVAWRCRIFGLPLVSPSSIFIKIRELVGDDAIAKLIANMVWWAGKARVAWINLLVENVVSEIVSHLRRGDIEEYLLSSAVLSREVVEGAPIFDRGGYREVRRILGEASYLAPIVSILVGPVPLSLVEKFVGSTEDFDSGIGLVHTKYGVRVENLLKAFEVWLYRLARSRGISGESVDQAIYILSLVFDAWSLNGVIPYDLQAIRELVSIAADLAREVYLDNVSVQDLIESLRVDIIGPEPVRLPEPIIALRPSLITRIYPLLVASPLIGCARRAGITQVKGFVENLTYNEVSEYSERLVRILSLSEMVSRAGFSKVLFMPQPLLTKYVKEVVCEAIDTPIVLFSNDNVHEAIRFLELIGRVLVVELSEKPALFLQAALYSESLGIENCALDKLQMVDQRALSMYSELLKTSLLNKLATRGENLTTYIERLKASIGSLGKAGIALFALAIASRGSSEVVEALASFEEVVNKYVSVASRLMEIVVPPVPTLSQAYREIVSTYVELEQKGLGIMLNILHDCGKQDEITKLLTQNIQLPTNNNIEDMLSMLIDHLKAIHKHIEDFGLGKQNTVEELINIVRSAMDYYEKLAAYDEPGIAVAGLIAASLPLLTQRLLEQLKQVGNHLQQVYALVNKLRDMGVSESEVEVIIHDISEAIRAKTINVMIDKLNRARRSLSSLLHSLETIQELHKQREELRSKLMFLLESLSDGNPSQTTIMTNVVEG